MILSFGESFHSHNLQPRSGASKIKRDQQKCVLHSVFSIIYCILSMKYYYNMQECFQSPNSTIIINTRD
jgi:hypothetical protein